MSLRARLFFHKVYIRLLRSIYTFGQLFSLPLFGRMAFTFAVIGERSLVLSTRRGRKLCEWHA
jgi:hypothetical protein